MVCKKSSTLSAVEHYYNNGYSPEYIDSANPTLGLSSSSIEVSSSSLICRFSRENSNSNTKYFNLNSAQGPFVIVAFGSLSGSSKIKHLIKLFFHIFKRSSLKFP